MAAQLLTEEQQLQVLGFKDIPEFKAVTKLDFTTENKLSISIQRMNEIRNELNNALLYKNRKITNELGFGGHIHSLNVAKRAVSNPTVFLDEKAKMLSDKEKNIQQEYQRIYAQLINYGWPKHLAKSTALSYAKNMSAVAFIEVEAKYPDSTIEHVINKLSVVEKAQAPPPNP